MFDSTTCILLALITGAQTATRATDGATDEAADRTDIIVIGRRPVAAPGVIDRYSSDSIRTLSALTIGEVIARLERRNGGRPFSIIVNGKRLADISDLREIPPEALAEIQILANSRAGSYGLPPENQVLNLVLKKQFAAFTTDATVRVPTEGGGISGTSALRHVNIRGERRFNAVASVQGTSALVGRDRQNLIEDDTLARFRTLLPSGRVVSLTTGYAVPISSTSLNISASLSDALSRQQSRFIASGATSAEGEDLAVGVIDVSRTRSLQTGVSASGIVDRLNWTGELTGAIVAGRTSSQRSRQTISLPGEEGMLAPLPATYSPLAARTNNVSIGLAFTANSPLISLPAGEMNANTRISTNVQRLSVLNHADRSRHRERYSQARSRFHAGLDIPLVNPAMPVIGEIGTLSLSMNGDYEHASDTGAYPGYDASLNWQPSDFLTISLSKSRIGTPPVLSRSQDPILYSPGTLVIDAATGEYAVVTRISGGVPDIRGMSQSDTAARVSFSKAISSTNISATLEYATTRITDPVILTAYPSLFFQRLFPDRFLRDANGALTAIDTRPFNALEERRNVLRSNLHIAGRTGDETSPETIDSTTATNWDLSIAHEWAVRAALRPSTNSENIDLLRTPLDGVQGTPRHRINIEASASRGNVNLQVSARWRSGTSVNDTTGSHAEAVRYSAFWTADAEVSLTLSNGETASPDQGSMRLWLSVENLFNKRLSVRDASGNIPAAFQPAFLDPLGRIVAIRLSKPL